MPTAMSKSREVPLEAKKVTVAIWQNKLVITIKQPPNK